MFIFQIGAALLILGLLLWPLFLLVAVVWSVNPALLGFLLVPVVMGITYWWEKRKEQ